MTLEEARAGLAAIETALGRGESMVVFADRTVMYRTVDQLMAARAFWAGQVASLSGRPKQSVGFATKGFDQCR